MKRGWKPASRPAVSSKAARAQAPSKISIDAAKLAKLMGAAAARKPTSKFADVLSYFQALKKDAPLAIATVRLTRMLMTGRWEIVNTKTGKPLPRGDERDAPVVELFEQPNRWQRWPEFCAQFMIHRTIAGNAFVFQDSLTAGGQAMSMVVLDPTRVKIIADPVQFVGGYSYRANGAEIPLPADRIHHSKWMPDPEDPHWGIGVVGMNEQHFNITVSMEEWIWGLFTNGAHPDGIIGLKEELGPEAYNRLLTQFEDRFSGSRNSHKPLVLENGATYTNGKGPEEMDFHEGRKQRMRETLALAGVPPIRAGFTEDLNFASAFIQDTAFIRDTYLPTVEEISDFFMPITRAFGPYRLEFEKHRAITDPASDTDRAVKMWQGGLGTIDEARETLGLEPLGLPETTMLYAPVNLVPLKDLAMPAAAAPAAGGPAATVSPDGKIEIKPPFPAPGDTSGGPPAAPPAPVEAPAPSDNKARPLTSLERATSLQRRMHQFQLARRGPIERSTYRMSRRFFAWQRDQIISRIMNGAKDVGDAIDLLADGREWQRVTSRFYSAVLQDEFDATVELLGYDAPATAFAPGTPGFETRMDRLARDVSNVSTTTREKLADLLADGVNRGLTPKQIAYGTDDFKGVEGMFEEFAGSRAMTIARTESARAQDQATLESYGQALRTELVDVIGCEDSHIMPGQEYGCLSTDIPIAKASDVKFHPNHQGTFVPQVRKALAVRLTARVLTAPDGVCLNRLTSRLLRLEDPEDAGALLEAVPDRSRL